MPQVDDLGNPVPEQRFGDPEVDVGPLYAATVDYVVIGLHQNTRYPPDGRVIPDIDVTFRIPGLPGTFIRRIDNYAFTHADVLAYMRERALQLRQIFALPGEYTEGAPATVTIEGE
jgi:hypothetical protein